MADEAVPSEVDVLTESLVAAHRAIDELRAEVADLRRQRDPRPRAAEVRPEPVVSRRALFGLAGAGIAGVAVGAGASPAAAADGDPVILGSYNESADGTAIRSTGSGGNIALHIETTATDGLGLNVSSFGPKGLWAGCSGARGIGANGTAMGEAGIGVLGDVPRGNSTSLTSVHSRSRSIGVAGIGDIGVQAHAHAGSQLRLVRDTEEEFVGPSSPDYHHDQGEISLDSRGDLFLCTVAGTPGTWTRLNQQGAAFLPTAERAFDSRAGREPLAGGGAKGLLASGEARTIDLTVATGLPATARAAIVNLTATGTANAGYLSVYPGATAGSGTPTFSHINWTSSGQTIANTTTVTLVDGKVTVYAAQPTHVVVDVIGWHPGAI